MSLPDDWLYLSQMLEYARIVEQEVAQVSRQEFDTDGRTQSHLLRFVQNIGEAATKVSAIFKAAHPEIDWVKIIGMRHHLVHGYDRINLNKVWQTATEDIPHLITNLANLLP